MIKVNLVPADILAKAQQKHKALQIGLGCGLLLLAVALFSLAFQFRLRKLRSELAVDTAELTLLQAQVAKVEEKEKTKKELDARLNVIKDLDRGRRAYPYFMCDFVTSVPGGVRVKSLNTTGGGSAQMRLTISAEARSNEDIKQWVQQMENAGRFAAIELGPVTLQNTTGLPLRSFTLTALYTPQL